MLHRHWIPLRASVAVAVLAIGAQAALAQDRRLGKVEFPNSGSAAAQPHFLEGVLLLHSFEFDDAAASFRRAQDADPDFALAYWGEAMTYNHPLWQEQDGEAARSALARYEARGAAPPTERERAYLGAVSTLYGDGSKTERDLRYMDGMRRLHETWPDDLEARTFYALSILGSTDGVRDFATYMRAAAVAQPAFDANPDHPGAVHYLIHSFDDPVHAPLGLPAARAYSAVAPDAGHAQHMTSHIFVALGMWNDVVTANVRARDVQNRGREATGLRPNVCGHYTSWLHYGYLMQGRPEDATRGMDACMARMRENPTAAEQRYYATMRARQVLDLEDWDAVGRYNADLRDNPWARGREAFVTAYVAARTGERGRAEALLLQLGNGEAEPRIRIEELEIRALLALDEGDADRAIALLRDAVRVEESLPFEFGPPASLKPPHELLGDILLEAGQAQEAVEAFRQSLSFTPGRTLSLMGLSMAAQAAGLAAVAEDAERQLDLTWDHAEPAFAATVGR